MTTLTVEQFKAIGEKGRRGKYNARQVVFEGIRYHSMSELAFEFHLRKLRADGLVEWWTRQVPFYIPSVTKPEDPALRYLCDFLIVMKGGGVRVIDVKGADTSTSKTKRAVVQATHRIEVEVVKAGKSYTWR